MYAYIYVYVYIYIYMYIYIYIYIYVCVYNRLLYDFQVRLQCWWYHYYLLIRCSLSNYDVTYLFAYIKSH